MQQLFYDGAAYAILSYPFQLEAYNDADWQGWVQVPGDAAGGQQGAVLYSYNNIDTYRFVQPVAASATAESSSNTTTIVVVAVIAVVVVLGIVVLLLRRGGRAETE